ncbi:MAG: hypothetical protein KAJ24_06525, partial [Candidatus Aenigmarchaeota archaeon]|nr:hypothetical protein [Candidatus Aenigmarchaeota archaeon]
IMKIHKRNWFGFSSSPVAHLETEASMPARNPMHSRYINLENARNLENPQMPLVRLFKLLTAQLLLNTSILRAVSLVKDPENLQCF